MRKDHVENISANTINKGGSGSLRQNFMMT